MFLPVSRETRGDSLTQRERSPLIAAKARRGKRAVSSNRGGVTALQ
jgi:hypothetical protein